MRKDDAERGIPTEAWSPLGRVFTSEVLEKIAQKFGKSVAQVVLSWHVELGNVVIPKSETRARLIENLKVYEFALDVDDLAAIRTLENGERTGDDPDRGSSAHRSSRPRSVTSRGRQVPTRTAMKGSESMKLICLERWITLLLLSSPMIACQAGVHPTRCP